MPLIESDRQLCIPLWNKQIRNSPIKMAINEILPIENDLDMLKGALIYDATIHEALIHHKKTLAVEKYCEMAARLTTSGCFPVWLLHDVPLAGAGTCLEKDGSLKVVDLEGAVVLTPIVKFVPD